ncbi:hypothetical protein F8M41_025847 [Gigaspora margarita]|uniref:Uncharacterized protein n=1 Tax=Gigaspora margarita TaxID=4874 RepID=A0A8H3XIJ7_GIGMA|nr:hypothetical protein F8M41_025847 [Gigaspora margarita]
MVRLCKISIGGYHPSPIKEFDIEISGMNFAEMEHLFEISDQTQSTNIKFSRDGGHGCITLIPSRPFKIRLSNLSNKINCIHFNYNDKEVSLYGNSIDLYTRYNTGEITYDNGILRLEIPNAGGNNIIDSN